MSEKQRHHVDALLALKGKAMFNVAPAAFTAQALAKDIQSAESKHSPFLGWALANCYVIGKGLLEVSEREASFAPTGRPHSRYGGSNPTGLYGRLTPMQVSDLIRWSGPSLGAKMNAAQQASLREELETPGGLLSDELPAPNEMRAVVKYASTEPDDAIYLEFFNASRITLDANGAIVEKVTPWKAK